MRVGSFVSGEVPAALEMGLFDLLDLVALNIDEAGALIGQNPEGLAPEKTVQAAVEFLSRRFPHLWLSLTAGKNGSWSWDGTTLAFQPAFPSTVVSTAGAGDAHIGAIIAGLSAGLSLARAQELGTLVAALSVTSPHTIAPEVERENLARFAREQMIELSEEVGSLVDM